MTPIDPSLECSSNKMTHWLKYCCDVTKSSVAATINEPFSGLAMTCAQALSLASPGFCVLSNSKFASVASLSRLSRSSWLSILALSIASSMIPDPDFVVLRFSFSWLFVPPSPPTCICCCNCSTSICSSGSSAVACEATSFARNSLQSPSNAGATSSFIKTELWW